MMTLDEAFRELDKLYESKEDQERFISKFGKDRFDRFIQLKNKLQNVKDTAGKSIPVDIIYHTKNTDIDDLDTLLDRAENKQYTANVESNYDLENKLIPAPKNTKVLVGRNRFYDIYRVTDYTDAIDLAMKEVQPEEPTLGYWCIAGRYKLGDDKAVKVSQAKHYFNKYLNDYKTYYFCMPKETAEDKVVICAVSDNTFEAFDAWDTKLFSKQDLPEGSINFTDKQLNFTPEKLVYLDIPTPEELDEIEENPDDTDWVYDN